jgi:hypothetical protein
VTIYSKNLCKNFWCVCLTTIKRYFGALSLSLSLFFFFYFFFMALVDTFGSNSFRPYSIIITRFKILPAGFSTCFIQLARPPPSPSQNSTPSPSLPFFSLKCVFGSGAGVLRTARSLLDSDCESVSLSLSADLHLFFFPLSALLLVLCVNPLHHS